MKNIKNCNEIDDIKEMINKNRFCLTNALLDAEKLTDDRINNLDIDLIEDIVTNQIDRVIINEAKKDKMSYRLTQYQLELDIWVNDELYRVTNWFTYDKKENTFEDSEVYADNDYYHKSKVS